MALPTTQKLDDILATAEGFINQGNTEGDAQDLLVSVKIQIEPELGLESYLHAVNRYLGIAHMMQADALVKAEKFEQADDLFGQANNAFREFRDSFEQDEEYMADHYDGNRLAIYQMWVDSKQKLADQIKLKANDFLVPDEDDFSKIEQGMALYDDSIELYNSALVVVKEATAEKYPLDSAISESLETQLEATRSANVQWANHIGKPELAKTYLMVAT